MPKLHNIRMALLARSDYELTEKIESVETLERGPKGRDDLMLGGDLDADFITAAQAQDADPFGNPPEPLGKVDDEANAHRVLRLAILAQA